MSDSIKLVWISGPHAWESAKAADEIVGKLTSRFGIGRLLLIVDGDPGMSKFITASAHERGVGVLEYKAAYNVWNREAGRHRDVMIATVLPIDALIAVRYLELEGNNHRNVATAIEIADEHGISVIRVKVSPDDAIPSAKWARDRAAAKKKRPRKRA